MTQKPTAPEMIQEETLDQALGQRYLSYALSTIVSRSLPDARDGLKPVQRRLLYAMYESGNVFEKNFRKSASAVGYVMMKYHPHGDSAIYDALVRMAQPFSSRYPLVSGQGNFGSIDGDQAAAMRYTEARLSEISQNLLTGITENAVDFVDAYNGSTQEPQVLPAGFPNLLANGATGIAVGMATNVPPHNLNEVIEGLCYLIKNPQATVSDLMAFIPGPDFPTGGTIIEPQEKLAQIYQEGRGAIRLRARYVVEKLPQGQYQIAVTEIPYQVQKTRLIEKIASLWEEKKLPQLADIRDESATDVRIVLIPKSRTIDPELLMASLFRVCDLEVRFAVNLNVLDRGTVPKVMNLKALCWSYLDHQKAVLVRRSRYRCQQIDDRLEVLHGLKVVFLNLDEVIRIIRNDDDPRASLRQTFSLTDRQVTAILDTRLRALRKLEEMQIDAEITALEKERATLKALLEQEPLQWKQITGQLRRLQKKLTKDSELNARRTDFCTVGEQPDIPMDVFVEREPVTVICSENGWIRAIKGHNHKADDFKYKSGDAGKFIIETFTTEHLVIATTEGRFYTISVDKIPGGRGFGEPLSLMFDLQQGNQAQAMIRGAQTDKVLLASDDGRGFVASVDNLIAQTRSGKQILNPAQGRQLLKCHAIAPGHTHVALLGNNRKMLVYPLEEIPEMVRGRGVILQKYREGSLSDLTTFNIDQGLSWSVGSRNRCETDLTMWLGRRGQIGRQPPVGFPKSNRFIPANTSED